MRSVYLFGNGLSLAFNSHHYRLADITSRVRERLAGTTMGDGESLLGHLEQIAKSLRSDLAEEEWESFEEIAGPVDRLANTLSEFGPLTQVARGDQLRALRELERSLRSLYKRVVGATLESVMDHPPGDGGWGAVNTVADHLVRRAMRQGRLDVFCLNYDALLDSALLDARDSDPAGSFGLVDEFQGFDTQWVQVLAADSQIIEIKALPWRWGGYTPSDGVPLRLHHLHGAGTWMRVGDDVLKARHLDDIREAGLFSAWVEGREGQVEPAVILGDQKWPSVQRNPFNLTYEAFATAVSSADEIVLAGFSFHDKPLNRTIAAYKQSESRIVVVNPHEEIEEIARRALRLSGGDQLAVIHEPLPVGLTALE